MREVSIVYKYTEAKEELEELRNEYEKLGKKLRSKIKQVEKLELEVNKESLKSIKWLIQNPTKAGQYEAIREWVAKRYGGQYNGVSLSGYRANKDYSVTVQAFDFCLYNDVQVAKNNFKDFLAECLDYITPIDGQIIFGYGTGEYSGSYKLGYDTERGVWYTFVTQWSRDKDFKDHTSLDDALDYCIQTKPED